MKYVAGRLGSGLPAHVDEGDLVSYGLLGLIGAIERYDPERDVKFETYAIARIQGSIIDELRAMDWVPVGPCARPRHRARDRRARARSSTARRRTRRSPRSSASRWTSWASPSPTSPAPRLPLSTSSGRSRPGGGDQVALIDTIEDTEAPDPQGSLSQTEMKEAIGEAIARLPEREKLVVTLYYYEELTLREIGEVLGVTESRVSQLHTKAILRLKARLSGSTTRASLESESSARIRFGPLRFPSTSLREVRRLIRVLRRG